MENGVYSVLENIMFLYNYPLNVAITHEGSWTRVTLRRPDTGDIFTTLEAVNLTEAVALAADILDMHIADDNDNQV